MDKSDNSCNLSYRMPVGRGQGSPLLMPTGERNTAESGKRGKEKWNKGWRSSIWAPSPSYLALPTKPTHFYSASLTVGFGKSPTIPTFQPFPTMAPPCFSRTWFSCFWKTSQAWFRQFSQTRTSFLYIFIPVKFLPTNQAQFVSHVWAVYVWGMFILVLPKMGKKINTNAY